MLRPRAQPTCTPATGDNGRAVFLRQRLQIAVEAVVVEENFVDAAPGIRERRQAFGQRLAAVARWNDDGDTKPPGSFAGVLTKF